MTHSVSLIVICPAATLPAATALGVQLGWSENELSIPLSPTGAEPATHWAMHAYARPETAALFKGEWMPDAVDHAELSTVLSALIVSAIEGGQGLPHFESVLATESLQRIGEAA